MAKTEMDFLGQLKGQVDRAIKLAAQSPVVAKEVAEVVGPLGSLLERFNELAAESLAAPPQRQAEIQTELEGIAREVNQVAVRYQN